MTTTTTPTIAAIREALHQARADLDDALDLIHQVEELPPEVVARVSGAVEALAEALGEMANTAGPPLHPASRAIKGRDFL
jgi:hypothetical protein